MSNLHFSLPAKSKQAAIALPEVTQISFPSVTGVGDDIFCFCLISFPWSYCRRHISFPVARERQSNRISWPPGPFAPRFGLGRFFPPTGGPLGSGAGFTSSFDGEFRKIRSPHTVGV